MACRKPWRERIESDHGDQQLRQQVCYGVHTDLEQDHVQSLSSTGQPGDVPPQLPG
jgi:hypothetical protein